MMDKTYEKLYTKAHNYAIPPATQNNLVYYIIDRRHPGQFLEAVLSNNLKESVARADEYNQAALAEIIKFMYNHAPMNCYGSPEHFRAWLEGKQP
jgi:hypothetical protein